MPDFFSTMGGKRFLEGTVPSLVRAIEGLTEELKRTNDVFERNQALMARFNSAFSTDEGDSSCTDVSGFSSQL